jgi:hypothetical protein
VLPQGEVIADGVGSGGFCIALQTVYILRPGCWLQTVEFRSVAGRQTARLARRSQRRSHTFTCAYPAAAALTAVWRIARQCVDSRKRLSPGMVTPVYREQSEPCGIGAAHALDSACQYSACQSARPTTLGRGALPAYDTCHRDNMTVLTSVCACAQMMLSVVVVRLPNGWSTVARDRGLFVPRWLPGRFLPTKPYGPNAFTHRTERRWQRTSAHT